MNPYREPDCDTCSDTGVVAIPDDPGDRWSPPTGPWSLELCECSSGPSEWFDGERQPTIAESALEGFRGTLHAVRSRWPRTRGSQST